MGYAQQSVHALSGKWINSEDQRHFRPPTATYELSSDKAASIVTVYSGGPRRHGRLREMIFVSRENYIPYSRSK
jgi:hypothetical protein